MNGDMDGASAVPALVAKQQAHNLHARIIHEAVPLPQEILERSLVAVFEEQVVRAPQRLALAATEGALTYQELNATANRMANALLAMGTVTDVPVAIILERSLKTVVSIFAVLKIGGYFLCLEPTLPVERARELLHRAATRTIITTSAFASYVEEVAPSGHDCVLMDLILDHLPDQIANGKAPDNPEIPIRPSQPSRLGFTSGSTGTPKPSLKSHENYLYGAWQSSNAYLLSPADRHAFVYQFSAGPSMRALFSALLTGGSVHLHPGLNYDMGSWAAWIKTQTLTQLYMPTVSFRELLHTQADGCNFPSLRMVYVGGQTIFRQDAELFQRRICRGAILVSRFSMSETSGLAHYLVDHDTQFEGETLPIGYALPGREVLIIDEAGHPLGYNQPGEIAVRRLFPRAQETEAMSEGAKSEQQEDVDSALFFRTSDLGMQRPDGCLIHLGRKDDMVKVHGNRVALTEAENLLLKVSGVAQAAIKPFPTSSGDNRLVGYVTSLPDTALTVASVREEMSLLAPAYMVPARFVVLQTMPLTASGKVDRQALPAPGSTRPDLRTPFVAPSNETEEQIAGIWAELLDLDKIGVNDNFFDVGGDSITAMRMILKVEAATGATIPQDYFRGPTVAALAVYCTAGIAAGAAFETDSITGASLINEAELARQEHLPRPVWARIAKGEVTSTALLRRLIYQRLRGLAYSQGIQWLAWLGQPGIAGRLFKQQRSDFRTLAHELASPVAASDKTLDQSFAVSVLGNLMRDSFRRSRLPRPSVNGNHMGAMATAPERFWRTFAQQVEPASPDQHSPLFQFSGLEHLVHAQRRGCGAILLTYHSTASTLANVILAHQTNLGRIPTISLVAAAELAEDEWDEDEDRIEQASAGWAATYALNAQRTLQKGGVIRIVNDISYDAANSISKTIGRRQYYLKPGFAELALTTGASVLPVYSTFDAGGCIHMTILPALTLPAHSDAGRSIHDLLGQYATFLETTWRKFPESMRWGTLHRYNKRPLATPAPTQRNVVPLTLPGQR